MRGGWHGRAEDGHGYADCGIHLHTNRHVRKRTHTHTHSQTQEHKHTHIRNHMCGLGSVGIFYFLAIPIQNSVMKQALRLCRTGCGRRVSTARSFLCRICFGKQAVLSGSRSAGNKCPIRRGKSSAKGTLGNAGNQVRGKSKKIAGRAGAVKTAFNKESLERVFKGPTSRSIQSA